MSNKEENIDRFVKKVISHYDVRYDEAHWEALETRLNDEMPVVPPGGSTISIPTIIVSAIGGMVLMLGILWVTGTFDEKDVISNPVRENQTTGSISSINPVDEVINPTSTNSASVNNLVENQSSRDEQIGNDSKANGDLKRDSDSETSIDSKIISDPKTNQFNARTTSDGGQFFMKDDSNQVITSLETDEQGQRSLGMLQITRKSFNHEVSLAPYNELIDTDQSNFIFVQEEKTNASKAVIPKHKGPFSFSVALGVAPDLNSVGMDAKKALTGQAGVQFITTFKERVGLATGVFYGKKRYITNGENYYPPGRYWERFTNGVLPSEIDGHIVVIDIPVNLTYHWNTHGRIRFVSSVGISNYLILSEDCKYVFPDYNPGAEYGWDTEEMTKELLGVGNLSFGMLWYLNSRVNLRVEPYLKIPLKDVGWGNVDLYSAGSLISIQYTFN